MHGASGIEPFLREFMPFYEGFLARVNDLGITDANSQAYAMREKKKVMLPAINRQDGSYHAFEEHSYLSGISDRGIFPAAIAMEEELEAKASGLAQQNGLSARLFFRFINKLGLPGQDETLPLYLLFLQGVEFKVGRSGEQGILAHIGYHNIMGDYDPATDLNGKIEICFSPAAFLASDPEIHKKSMLNENYGGAIHPQGIASVIYDRTIGGRFNDGSANFYFHDELVQRFHVYTFEIDGPLS
jgi:hypothetical protein